MLGTKILVSKSQIPTRIPDTDTDTDLVPIRFDCDTPLNEGVSEYPSSCQAIIDSDRLASDGCYRFVEEHDSSLEYNTQCQFKKIALMLINNSDDPNFNGGFYLSDRDAAEEDARSTIADFYKSISYGQLGIHLDLLVEPYLDSNGNIEYQWYDFLSQNINSQTNLEVFRTVCFDNPDIYWNDYNVFITANAFSTDVLSGSQDYYTIDYPEYIELPYGVGCNQAEVVNGHYIILKNFSNDIAHWDHIRHELGHSLYKNEFIYSMNLAHAKATNSITGESTPYGDNIDTMGGNSGHFSVFRKVFLGWLDINHVSLFPDDSDQTNTVVETYRLNNLERNTVELKGIKIPLEEDLEYWIEARRRVDQWESLPSGEGLGKNLTRGASIREVFPSNDGAEVSLIKDATPETPTEESGDSALLPGRTYSDNDRRVHISVLAADSGVTSLDYAGWVDVEVQRLSELRQQENTAPENIIITITPCEEESDGFPGCVDITATAEDDYTPTNELLYFWSFRREKDSTYTIEEDLSIEEWGYGNNIRFNRNSRNFVHLAVSDKQGGVTWMPLTEINGNNQRPCIANDDGTACSNSTDTIDSTTVAPRNLTDDDPSCGDPCFKFLLSTDIRDPETYDARDSPHGILYRWNIDGELYSTLPEPSYFVTGPGNHSISLLYTDLDSNQWLEECYNFTINNLVNGVPLDFTFEKQTCTE